MFKSSWRPNFTPVSRICEPEKLTRTEVDPWKDRLNPVPAKKMLTFCSEEIFLKIEGINLSKHVSGRLPFSQPVVGEICRFHSSIVSNVLPLMKFHLIHNHLTTPHLGVDPVQVEGLALHLHCVVAVLINYASRK